LVVACACVIGRAAGIRLTEVDPAYYNPGVRMVAWLVVAGCRLNFDTQAAPPDVHVLPSGQVSVRDAFDSIAYDNSDGVQRWSTAWVEVGDDGSPAIAAESTIFIESHEQNPTPFDLALKIRVASAGQYIHREADLAGSTNATLSYRFHNELLSPGRVDTQVSPDGGANWITVQSYAEADVFGTETFAINEHATAATQIRFIAIGAGERHLRIDDVEIAFTRP
jgi:hypothetical protein